MKNQHLHITDDCPFESQKENNKQKKTYEAVKLSEAAYESMKGKPVTEKQEQALINLKYEGRKPVDRREAAVFIAREVRRRNQPIEPEEKKVDGSNDGFGYMEWL